MTECILKFQFPSFGNSSSCEGGGDWGGFLHNNCCGVAFPGYLYALSERANQTGQIYLNSTEQRNCLTSMKGFEGDVFGCGIEKLTSGGGGCSDFSVSDVVNQLGDGLRSLREDCKLLGSEVYWDRSCGACLRRWEEIRGPLSNSMDLMKVEADICRFAVLVSLTSTNIEDISWVQRIYRCLREESLPIDQQEINGRKNHTSTGLWILIGGLVGIALVVLIATLILLKRRIKSNAPHGKYASKDLITEEPNCMKVPIKEVYSATNNLNALNFIGQGIAGKVYKGVLSNGRHVAVKHIINDGYVETFVREVTSLSHVKHPNLVALFGYCEEEDECFLVYELCPNGNLSEWIFGKDKVLSWIQRLEIAIDSARGLWFLHTYPEGCIVHRDVKPTNILIGVNFEAKLSDFGLSKVIDLGQSYVSSEVRGTFGYLDPEYQQNHQVNSSGDVYSFGIVLLQVLSGKRVIDLNLKKPMPLDKMAKILTRGGNVKEFADPKLHGEYSTEAFDLTLKLALSCTTLKQQRPTMEQVVIRLEKALDISTRAKAPTPSG
ncbi:hypothetical protein HHK36_015141 [Tetracentron sinense]|uniref:Protein kinase domain-containing protein n=1 Tax=Tetracentron sinense TaxID=13715 RepID=A0A834Z8P0_TETSI|nr:hypothetical protein HHK36_015141 [Tetracentron sinense]